MADLDVTAVPVDGGASIDDAAVAAAAGGDTAPTGPGRALVVVNGDTEDHTATIAVSRTVSGLDVEDATLTVADGETGVIPLPRTLAGSDGRASISYDAVTSVTVAVIDLGR